MTMQVDQIAKLGIVIDFGMLFQLGSGAQLQVRIAFHHQQAHRPVAMYLHHDHAVEFQIGSQ